MFTPDDIPIGFWLKLKPAEMRLLQLSQEEIALIDEDVFDQWCELMSAAQAHQEAEHRLSMGLPPRDKGEARMMVNLANTEQARARAQQKEDREFAGLALRQQKIAA